MGNEHKNYELHREATMETTMLGITKQAIKWTHSQTKIPFIELRKLNGSGQNI